MKKIAIVEINYRCGMWHEWLMRHYEVVCFVSDDASVNVIKGIPVIKVAEISKYSFDAAVVVTNDPDNSLAERIKSECSEPVPVLWLDDFLKEEGNADLYEQEYVKTQVQVLKDILAATDEQIHDREWMYKKVVSYGLFCFNGKWYETDPDIRWVFCGMQQIPEEFTDYCLLLADLKVKTAIDIGVYRGRTSYFACAVLMRNNPELEYTLVDIEDRLNYFDEYAKVLPALKKAIPSTSADYTGKSYDYVFIDADHSYDASIADYNNVGQYASVFAGFHDVYAHEYDDENGGTVRMWQEVMQREQGNECRVFSKYPDRWMGIGCVRKR